MFGSQFVADSGPTHARLLVIGEAPGREENKERKGFCGAAGIKLNRFLTEVGLNRNDIRVSNVLPWMPTNNDFSLFPSEAIAEWTDKLHDRIAALPELTTIVPVGNHALKAILGKRVYDRKSKQRLTITKARGYSWDYTDRNGRLLKVSPTFHPAFVFRDAGTERAILNDLRRIRDGQHTSAIIVHQSEQLVQPTFRDIEAFYNEARERAEIMSIDIETARKPEPRITCVGFCFDPKFSMTIPLEDVRGFRSNADQMKAAMWIKRLCELPVAKTGHTFWYDMYWLFRKFGIRVRNVLWELSSMHCALDPRDEHSLRYLASFDPIRMRFWKEDAKGIDESERYASDAHALWSYCGLDNIAQRLLCDALIDRLECDGKMNFYLQHYQRLLQPMIDMSLEGIPVSGDARGRGYARLIADCFKVQAKLDEISQSKGFAKPLFGKNDGLSSRNVHEFLYETCKLPRQKSRKTGKTTADEVALRKLRDKHDNKTDGAISLILEHREKKKRAEFFHENRVDPFDGRMHSQFSTTTSTGRLKSASDPMGFGCNLQNLDRKIRDVFIPNPGCVLVSIDLSQVEDRVFKVMTHDKRMIELARLPPWEYDVHSHNASIIFGIEQSAVNYDQRYLAKRGVHGAERGLRGKRLSEELLKDGYNYTAKKCDGIIDRFMDAYPAIPSLHQRIRQTMLNVGKLRNSWGREIKFEFCRFDDELYREGYSWGPQSENADLINQYGFIPLSKYIKSNQLESRINIQVHDELVVSCPPDEAYLIARFAVDSLQRSREYDGVALSIPAEVKIGGNWKCKWSWKRFPKRSEFEQAVAAAYDQSRELWQSAA